MDEEIIVTQDNTEILEHLSRIELLAENQQILVNDILNLLADMGIFFIAFTAIITTLYVLFKEALKW